MINRKLNTTPLLPSEVLPGCEFRMGIETYVVTSVEGELYTAERLQTDFKTWADEYEVRTTMLPYLRPIDLWDYNNTLTDYLMKSLDFIREPLGIYRRMVGSYEVVLKDCFYLDDCARLSITRKGFTVTSPVWFFNELQVSIYNATGQMLYTPMGKRLMLTKKAIDS